MFIDVSKPLPKPEPEGLKPQPIPLRYQRLTPGWYSSWELQDKHYPPVEAIAIIDLTIRGWPVKAGNRFMLSWPIVCDGARAGTMAFADANAKEENEVLEKARKLNLQNVKEIEQLSQPPPPVHWGQPPAKGRKEWLDVSTA